MFPTLDLLKEGYEIYMPADACGDLSIEAHNRSMDRMTQAGAVPITSLQYVFELQQDWARSETYDGVMDILKTHSPYGIQVRFSKWALGEHASEAGPAALDESLFDLARGRPFGRCALWPAQRALAGPPGCGAGRTPRDSSWRAGPAARQTSLNSTPASVSWRQIKPHVGRCSARRPPGDGTAERRTEIDHEARAPRPISSCIAD